MNQAISTKDPAAVGREIQAAYLEIFPEGDKDFVPRIFQWVTDCFGGRYADYQAIDTRYHDFEHTLQGALCMAQILRGRHRAKATPVLSQRTVELGLLAILLHDTGYLKQRGDDNGTGAKYTVTHVSRSSEFAGQVLLEKGFPDAEIAAVQNMICCTGVDALLKVIPFQSEAEKITGLILGTSDLLGQMAADDYVEKLPVLYSEFAEAARFSSKKDTVVNMFASAADLLRKTPLFWEKYVKAKFERDFAGQYLFLNDPYPDGPNAYLARVEANIQKLKKIVASDGETTMFLKRHRA